MDYGADERTKRVTQLVLKGEVDGLQGSAKANGKEAKLTSTTFSAMRLNFSFNGDAIGMSGVNRVSGHYAADQIIGTGEWSDGKVFSWSASRTEAFNAGARHFETETSDDGFIPEDLSSGRLWPFENSRNNRLLCSSRNATLWTSGPQGNLENSDLLS